MSSPVENITNAKAYSRPTTGPENGVSLSLRMLGINEFAMEWDPIAGETASIERSKFFDGPYISIGTTTNGQFSDIPNENDTRLSVWFYRVVYPSITLGPESIVKPVDSLDPGDRAAVYGSWMARRHMARVGEKAALFSYLITGAKCPECWDVTLGNRLKSKCETCGGSGFLESKQDPILFQASFGKEEPAPERVSVGKISQQQTVITLSNYPRIKMGDLIVRYSDRSVFEVVRWQPTRHRSYIIRQNIITRLSERGTSAGAHANMLP